MADTFDSGAAAVIYAADTLYSWSKTLLLPGLQAAANIKLLNRQHSEYKAIRLDQRRIVNTALGNYVNQINAFTDEIRTAYPDVPQAANYVPVDPCAEQSAQIECNITHLGRADDWATCINRLNNQADITRAVFFDPKWYFNVDMYALSVGDLLRGRFPVNPETPVLADAVELEGFEARNGAQAFRPARNFGLTRGRMQATGRDELVAEAGMMERISPHARQMDIRDMMQTPQQRVALALTQAQLIQNSLQNVFNRNAEKPPYLMAQLSMKLERAINILQAEASKATMVNTFVPNYAAILQPQINSVVQGLDTAFSSPRPAPMSPPPMSAPPPAPVIRATK